MYEACGNSFHIIGIDVRKKFLDLFCGWSCAILGTYLTLSDFRSFARKLNVTTYSNFPIDYQYHIFFVKSEEENKTPYVPLCTSGVTSFVAALRNQSNAEIAQVAAE